MTYLILCILSNVGILLCFRLFGILGLNTFQAIVFNYMVCVVTGVLFQSGSYTLVNIDFTEEWFWIAILLGGIFIGTFYIMALTTQRFSMTVSSIASKMSLIIPVLISIIVLNTESKHYTLMNYLGMICAFPAIVMSSIPHRGVKMHSFRGSSILLPLSVFGFSGIIDTTINYTNFHYLNEQIEPIFPIVIFMSASVIGVIVLLIKKGEIGLKNVLGGIVLGIINYFSIYFLIKTLSSFQNDGAVVYPLLNIGIILGSTGASIVLFNDKLNLLNKAGLLLAIISIILISYQYIVLL